VFKKYLPATLCLLALCCGLFYYQYCLAEEAPKATTAASAETTFFRDGVPLRQIVDQWKLALPLKDARIVITKEKHRLDLYSGQTLVKSYHVALGSNPIGAKVRRGDGRTPEGEFYICMRNGKDSAFHLFLGLSYPGLPRATDAVNSKQITWQQFQAIRSRLASRGTPLWNTDLGGWVGIHGGSNDAYAAKVRKKRGSSDWTAGCIALTNREIEEIAAAAPVGTPVTILP